MNVSVKVKTIVLISCEGEGCSTFDESERVAHISDIGVSLPDLPDGWKRHLTFTVRSDEKLFCPGCVQEKLSDGWVRYRADSYIGLSEDESTWFEVSP